MKMGIKNTQEVLGLVRVIALSIISEIKKDGFQPSDLVTFVKSDDFLTVLMPALEGIEFVDDELKDLDWAEGYELSKDLLIFGKEVITHLRAS